MPLLRWRTGIFPALRVSAKFRFFYDLLSHAAFLVGRIHEKKCRSIKRGKKKAIYTLHIYSFFINDEDPSKNFDQKVWYGIDRFSSLFSVVWGLNFYKMEKGKGIYKEYEEERKKNIVWSGREFQSIKSKTFFHLFEEQVWFWTPSTIQVHQTLEAGIVSSRKYFPLYFNSHQKVIHLFRE